MTDFAGRSVSYPCGILPPYPSRPPKLAPNGYHPFPFCRGEYRKYCVNPWACPVGAVWLKEDVFRALHWGTESSKIDNLTPHLADFSTNIDLITTRDQQMASTNDVTNAYGLNEQSDQEDKIEDNRGGSPATSMTKTYYTLTQTNRTTTVESNVLSATPSTGNSLIWDKILDHDVSTKSVLKSTPHLSKVQPVLGVGSAYKSLCDCEGPVSVGVPNKDVIQQKIFAPQINSKTVLKGRSTILSTKTVDGVQCKWGNCSMAFPTQSETLDHIKHNHIGSRKQQHYDFTCRIRDCPCRGKVFEKRDNIVSHVTNVGFDIRYAVCPYRTHGCGVALKREWDLPRHVRGCKYNPAKSMISG